MVLLSAAVCSKSGKAIVSRQFMEISRSRIEGLLAAFPKLINSEEQHTFVETDSVRYVYQPMDVLFMVLITTKNSNILEDLETLRLFAKVIPEYCRAMTEQEVSRSAFDLIFAFDEIVALGYRESVTLQQIRTYIAMDSHDENLYKMVKKNKEKEAQEAAKRKAKELQMQRREQARTGTKGSGFAGGFGSDSSSAAAAAVMSSGSSGGRKEVSAAPAALSTSAFKPAPESKKPGRGMKLGGKPKTNEFVDSLMGETDSMPAANPVQEVVSSIHSSPTAAPPQSAIKTERVHIKVDEKVTLTATRDGVVDNMEVKGVMFLNVSDPDLARIRIYIDKGAAKDVPYQTHPNVDKKLFGENVIGLKSADRPFPVDSEVGVVRWRVQSTEQDAIPISINCWPNTNNDGSCDVNVEYELQQPGLELRNVIISIPVPVNPVVSAVDGDYRYDSRRAVLDWQIPVVDAGNKTGTLEFSTKSNSADDFFPVLVNFTSTTTYAGISIVDVKQVDNKQSVAFSSDVAFTVDKYEIL